MTFASGNKNLPNRQVFASVDLFEEDDLGSLSDIESEQSSRERACSACNMSVLRLHGEDSDRGDRLT